MSTAGTINPEDVNVIDVRLVRQPDRHAAIVAMYRSLSVGDSLIVVNDHDPQHLREEFEKDRPGSFEWEHLTGADDDWRVRITKLTSTALPRRLTNTHELADDPGDLTTQGAIWNLDVVDRDLDANVIAIPPGGRIDRHAGPDLGVMFHVLSGSGQIVLERGAIDLEPGDVIWLPARSYREIIADSTGLRYLTVHQKRQSLVIDTAAHRQP